MKQYFLSSNFTWPDKLNKFKDLIYCPLDLPAPPIVDLAKFFQWALIHGRQHSRDKYEIKPGLIARSPESQTREAVGYTTWYYCWAKHYTDQNHWIGDFDIKFPELVEYSKLFPFDVVSSMSFIIQQQNTPSFLHVDPDEHLGMRYYLFNNVGNKLYFHKTLTKLDTKIDQWDMENGKLKKRDWPKIVDTNNKIYANIPELRIPWCVTSLRAVHGVDPMTEVVGSKITGFVYGAGPFTDPSRESQYNFDKLHDLLERSVEKYHQYAIWF